ncbi:MAG: hypothetical protein WBG86_11345 [Polyangiales bacterium]
MRYALALAAASVLFAPIAHADEAVPSGSASACPEFVNMVAAMRSGGGSSTDLGMEQAIAKQKKKGIYRGWDNSVRLEGPGAKVGVRPSTTFAFRPINPDVHPAQQIKLYPFSTKKGYRELLVGGTNIWGGSKDKRQKDDSIPLTFEKIKKGCYKVTAVAPLPKGQYAFSLGSVGQGTSADVQGTSAGWGSNTQGQTWFGFSVVPATPAK